MAAQDGWIYFIVAAESGIVKIGWAKDPAKRLLQLQTANHLTLSVFGTTRGTVKQEQALHRRFRHLRIRGEWFKIDEELTAFLSTVQTGGFALPESPEPESAPEPELDDAPPTTAEIDRWLAEQDVRHAAEAVELLPLLDDPDLPKALLSPREALVFRRHAADKMTDDEIGKEIGTEGMRARQIQYAAQRKLRWWRDMRTAWKAP
jgi:hypothetical protein